ncbi:heme transporter hrg1-B-like [Diaphorina citri]|uniref:Heme transporter hrg1-B-like n=1 Tax=Diaphorina citri TaxID=121845 RepID=A0A1S3DDL8_DIACI|nr:heme transporter hrg1-B-like [Diaphorina citri]KAI5702916.1 hypothetical protein M8J75_005555 [Diaphorina citri]KAI5733037.1 hypothetical protein M8J76_006888 [Diaphorina citri]KAI5739679.1 hypothetical protein M8J77_022068 [Diaphorina citri]
MNKTTVKLALSGLGAFLGLFAFVVFFFIYGNNRAGVWALFSAIFALAFYHITWLYKTGNLLQWHDVESLDMIIHFSFFVAILSTAVMTWYIFEAVYFKEGIYPISDSSQISAVWSFMCAKWTFALHFAGKGYKTEYNLR